MDLQTLFYTLGIAFFTVLLLIILILTVFIVVIYAKFKRFSNTVKTSYNIVSKIQEWKKQPLPVIASLITVIIGYVLKLSKDKKKTTA